MTPRAWAVPDANTAPPTPAVIAGIAGSDPAMTRIALRTLMALGCSLVIESMALQAFSSQLGALVVAETTTNEGGIRPGHLLL